MQYTREKSKEHINTENKNTKAVKVSLIVPMYLCEEFVEELLENLCGQDFRDIEIICVVDGSPDDTLKLVKEYSGKDSRIRIFSQEHKGGRCCPQPWDVHGARRISHVSRCRRRIQF